jgi:hypothetical protein
LWQVQVAGCTVAFSVKLQADAETGIPSTLRRVSISNHINVVALNVNGI